MNRSIRFAIIVLAVAALTSLGWAQAAPAFAPFDQWKTAVLAGDAVGLKRLYSTSPPAQVAVGKVSSDASAEVEFWVGFKAHKIKFEITQTATPQAGVQVVTLQAEVRPVAAGEHTVYITESQAWQQQADQWRIVATRRRDPAYLKQPADINKSLYPAEADARAEIKQAEEKAAKEHKRVLLVFGANWCYDCHVLDLAFQRSDFAPVVARYEVVHVDIGPDGKKNGDLATQFQVPLAKGVPALAVLDSAGNVLVSQKNGEFENARAMTPEAMLEFLNKWKLEAR